MDVAQQLDERARRRGRRRPRPWPPSPMRRRRPRPSGLRSLAIQAKPSGCFDAQTLELLLDRFAPRWRSRAPRPSCTDVGPEGEHQRGLGVAAVDAVRALARARTGRRDSRAAASAAWTASMRVAHAQVAAPTASIAGTLPPCEFMKTSLRQPARATLSPISVQTRDQRLERQRQRAGIFDVLVRRADRLQRQEQHRQVGGQARDRAREIALADERVDADRQMRPVLLDRRDAAAPRRLAHVGGGEVAPRHLGPKPGWRHRSPWPQPHRPSPARGEKGRRGRLWLAPAACVGKPAHGFNASSSSRASASGSRGKPARIHNACNFFSVAPTRWPWVTPRATTSAPVIGSVGSGRRGEESAGAGEAPIVGAARRCRRGTGRARRARPGGGARTAAAATRRAPAAPRRRADRRDRGRRSPAARSRRWRAAVVRAAARRPLRSSTQSAPRRSSGSGASPHAASIAARRAKRAESVWPATSGSSSPASQIAASDFGGARRDEQLHQLGAHPLARQDRQTLALGDRGVEARRVEPAVAVAGGEAEEAQDAQIVLADALARIADETDATVGEVGEPADVIVHRPVARRATAR